MIRFRTGLSWLLGIALLIGVGATPTQRVAAEELTVGEAINIAGRQRMLSQRLVKAYCQVGLGILPAQSRQQLREALGEFDDQLATLKRFARDSQVQEALAQVETIWREVRGVAEGEVNREGAERLLYLNDDLLYASHKVVLLLQDQAGSSYARLVNIAGRQRMLSQRLAKYYMLRGWDFDTQAIDDALQSARNEFSGALQVLLSASENTEGLDTELEIVALQWEWLQHALELDGGAPYRLIVADASESILRSMEEITQRYEKMVKARHAGR